MAAEAHVVHHSDPELNGVGGDHVRVKVLHDLKIVSVSFH